MITVNSLLLFLPLGVIAALLNWNSVLVSVFNFLAILPLSAIVSDASDTLSDYFGDLVGGLINATFGNAVELSVCFPILYRGSVYHSNANRLDVNYPYRLEFWP